MLSYIVTSSRRKEITDRKGTRLNSSHLGISYAVFCLKKKEFGPDVACLERDYDRDSGVYARPEAGFLQVGSLPMSGKARPVVAEAVAEAALHLADLAG